MNKDRYIGYLKVVNERQVEKIQTQVEEAKESILKKLKEYRDEEFVLQVSMKGQG